MGHPRPFIVGLFQTNINATLQQIKAKIVHPVYGAGIRTHNFLNMSRLP